MFLIVWALGTCIGISIVSFIFFLLFIKRKEANLFGLVSLYSMFISYLLFAVIKHYNL